MEGAILVNGDPDNGPSQYEELNELYDECLKYLQDIAGLNKNSNDYQMIDKFSDDNYEEFEETTFNVTDTPIITQSEIQNQNETIGDANNIDESAEDAEDEFGEVTSNRSLDCADNQIKNSGEVNEITNDVNENTESGSFTYEKPGPVFKIENEIDNPSSSSGKEANRLRRLSEQLPKIIITESNTSLNKPNKIKGDKVIPVYDVNKKNHVAFAKDVK